MKTLRPFIKDIPFAMLLINGLLVFAAMLGAGDWIYFLIPQISGHGILILILAAFYARLHKFCIYSWLCLGALAALNVLNILYFFVKMPYYDLYVFFLTFPIFLMYAVYRIRKRNAPDQTPV